MKFCLDCSATYPADRLACPACGKEPPKVNGITAYAPELAGASSGFKASYFADIFPLEEGHFWFRSRNRLIIWALQKYCPDFHSFLEIGCGTAYVLSGLAKAFPQAHLQGSEIFIAGLEFAAERQPGIDFIQLDARKIPFVEEFDAVGAFDVLEHIKEDEQVLAQIHQSLKPGGIMVLTVPQHPWLWSPVDDYACHERRYTAGELRSKVESAGFDIMRSTSFVSSLLPAMFASRLLQRGSSVEELDPASELRISPALNLLFGKLLDAEIAAIRCGINLPAGGSRLIVAKRK